MSKSKLSLKWNPFPSLKRRRRRRDDPSPQHDDDDAEGEHDDEWGSRDGHEHGEHRGSRDGHEHGEHWGSRDGREHGDDWGSRDGREHDHAPVQTQAPGSTTTRSVSRHSPVPFVLRITHQREISHVPNQRRRAHSQQHRAHDYSHPPDFYQGSQKASESGSTGSARRQKSQSRGLGHTTGEDEQVHARRSQRHSSRRGRPSNSNAEDHSMPASSYGEDSLSKHLRRLKWQYSNCTGRKKALLIGINYTGQDKALKGCQNDAKNIRKFLIDHGYNKEDIVLLTDDSTNPRSLPTRRNMIDGMKWLVREAKTHDSLFFHYSGHGGRTPDKDGMEVDGYDEVIFPLDFKEKGQITDDRLHEIMVKPLPIGCRLTAIIDCCHSGTALDLPYIYSSDGQLKKRKFTARWLNQKATSADVISWSGCMDNQTSADTFSGGVAVGAMSHAFVATLKEKPQQSYKELLNSVRDLLDKNYSQTPQLGSSHHIDTSLPFKF